MTSPTIIQMPLFIPDYDLNESYGYKKPNNKRLLDLLYKTSKGYCMYCYCKVDIDSKRFADLEHAIEKSFCEEKLLECVPNIGLACQKCNSSFKNVGLSKYEKNNRVKGVLTNRKIENFKQAVCDNPSKCIKECKAYKTLKKSYISQRNIILQPMGVKKNRQYLRIQYNLLKFEFEPSSLINYSDDDKEFINNHINQFNLNDSVYRSREILKFCEDVINGDVYLRRGKYNNLIVDLFMDNLEELNEKQRKKICSTLYSIGKVKGLI